MKLFVIPFVLLAVQPNCPNPPNPNPTPVPTPVVIEPTPTPTPNSVCSFPQGVPDDQFKEVPNPGLLNDRVNQIVSAHTGCAINSDCVLGSSDPQFYLATIISWIQAEGICAGQHVNGHSDEIAVANSCEAGVAWEGYHIVNFGQDVRRVAWSAIRPAWKVPVSCGNPNPQPTPTPPVKPTPPPFNPSCGAPPRPPCDANLNCPPSVDKINVTVRDQSAWIIDATPQTCNKDWCNANGFAGRNCCPLGPEGNDSRAQCEARFAPYNWSLDGQSCPNQDCWLNGDPPNPLQLRVPKSVLHGNVSVCITSGVCGTGSF